MTKDQMLIKKIRDALRSLIIECRSYTWVGIARQLDDIASMQAEESHGDNEWQCCRCLKRKSSDDTRWEFFYCDECANLEFPIQMVTERALEDDKHDVKKQKGRREMIARIPTITHCSECRSHQRIRGTSPGDSHRSHCLKEHRDCGPFGCAIPEWCSLPKLSDLVVQIDSKPST